MHFLTKYPWHGWLTVVVAVLAEDFLSEEAQELMDKSMKIKAFIYVLLGGECNPSVICLIFRTCADVV